MACLNSHPSRRSFLHYATASFGAVAVGAGL
ncbi:ubiquinol-cytochrome c reductase iron-sulfur subunit N-terminal domain-containing protein [Actibacterium sp. 188UL27-1]